VRWLLVAWIALVAAIGSAAAQGSDDESKGHTYRAVVDRVDLEPASLTGMRLRVYLSAVALQGQLLDLTDPKTIKLYLGSSEKKVPYALGTYDATNSDTAIVVLVQATLDYSDALPLISDALDRGLLSALDDKTQVAVLPYGESVTTGKLAAIKSVRGKVALSSDNSAGEPAMLDTLDRALLLLKKAKTTPEGRTLRKMVLVVGDGRDLAADRDRVTRTGQRAAKAGVRIHTIAFSASDVRRPMLALGELSKRSLGTFRWVRTAAADSWQAAFEQLRDEINRQYVLTYFVTPDDDVAGKKLHIVTVGRTEATSNDVKVPSEPGCAGTPCATGYCADDKCLRVREDGGRGVLGWILLIGGILVGLVVLLGVIGYIMTRMQQRQQAQPPMPYPHPGMQPGMQPGMYPGMQMPPQPVAAPTKQKKQKKQKGAPVVVPGFLPSGRPIPALLIMNGPRTGERHLLRNGFLIGKQPGCDLIFEDGFTSSQHAQIGMDEGGNCKLYDRGSTNGTYINGVRINESGLQHGASIKIGATEIRFLAE
jgi:hypothetical protein